MLLPRQGIAALRLCSLVIARSPLLATGTHEEALLRKDLMVIGYR